MNTSRPNILFIVVDCLRADHLGCYGYPRPTSPNIDALAAQGAVFEDFFAAGVPTQPSFTTMYTGQRPLTHGIVSHKSDDLLAPGSPWLPSLLRKSGYTTASFCCLARYQQWFVHGFEFLVDSTTRYHDFGYTCETINNRAIRGSGPPTSPLHGSALLGPSHAYLPPRSTGSSMRDPPTPACQNGAAETVISGSCGRSVRSSRPVCGRYVVSLTAIHHADDGAAHVLDESGHADDTIVDHGSSSTARHLLRPPALYATSTAHLCSGPKRMQKWARRSFILSRQPDFHGMPSGGAHDLSCRSNIQHRRLQPERTRSLESRSKRGS